MTTTIYITALFFGAAIGIIYMLAKRKEKEVFPKVLNELKEETVNEQEYISNRIRVEGTNIYINNTESLRYKDIEIQPILKLETALPEITIYEDGRPIRTFTIEPKGDTDLQEYYFHSSIRVNANSSVQIDGYLSKDAKQYGDNAEGIRFQPFFLSDCEEFNERLKGKGMFQRGLHYEGIITSGDVRLICICDECNKSFGVQFYHAGFSEVQYFYSTHSKEALLVPYNSPLGKVPMQLQADINIQELAELEAQLPPSSDGCFRYYNNFCCPHCAAPYINFGEHKETRPTEYYVNFYLNQKPLHA